MTWTSPKECKQWHSRQPDRQRTTATYILNRPRAGWVKSWWTNKCQNPLLTRQRQSRSPQPHIPTSPQSHSSPWGRGRLTLQNLNSLIGFLRRSSYSTDSICEAGPCVDSITMHLGLHHHAARVEALEAGHPGQYRQGTHTKCQLNLCMDYIYENILNFVFV